MGSRRVVLGLGRAHYGGEFDAAGDDTGRQGILSQGMPPTCPCNVIHATRQVDGQWQPTEWLTVHTDDYDWPLSPCTRFGADGRLHAFWTQLGSAGDLMPHRRSLEYWARTDTGWVDLGDELNPYEAPGLGARVALDFAGPFFAAFTWTVKDTIDGVPQPRRVVHARTHWLTGVDDATPPAVVTLAAWPSPFNPRLQLAGRVTPGATATLTVHDLAGRRVATLPATADPEGRVLATWDGRDARGRAAHAGVYLVRLTGGTGSAVARAVLVK